MSRRMSIAMNWAGACGGCDVSLLDTQGKLLELTAVADVVYWPVALDYKRSDLEALPEKSVDIGLFNGVVRTSEQAEDARRLRERCRVLVAYGACACHGGIPGLANQSDREEIFRVAYQDTVSTDNPDQIRPQQRTPVPGGEVTLPAFHDSVRALHQVVDVDYFLPGCPPTPERILDLLGVVQAYNAGDDLPPAGSILAPEATLCQECPRAETRRAGRMPRLYRPHEIVADPETCFLEQGVICMGPFTRGGCGSACITVNMPCRGCFGPAPGVYDPGAEALSVFGSVAGEGGEDFLSRGEMKRAVNSFRDPLGSVYRFTLPCGIVPRKVKDNGGK
ncbi:NADH ubiquinone dehydrogenase [Desulfohalobium retbaense]|uniref:NADH ubiquinone oxidoreductase 20 kDa subunit n=1 Tax=Desulfohalobium retbaense (strain ATCC 49708 / DSM 5692 / JCM 16813 / HR100) TaxID=485915 RepID=C8X546_DESRD|nr:NADH ubiquinone dehydrogenase [Desulfohalobium retbaense]ACV69543.1 NADH ubiquinone oxidoreductase 20 kDa subunit [Desulfohalobium retbaense DSM 5692]